MSASQSGTDHKGEPPKSEKSADLAREKSPGFNPSDRIIVASGRRRGAPFTTLGLAAVIALCALAFLHPDEVETFAINRLRDLSLADAATWNNTVYMGMMLTSAPARAADMPITAEPPARGATGSPPTSSPANKWLYPAGSPARAAPMA